MAFTVREFDDLLRIIEAQPEWRSRLRRALFPEIDIPKALQELAEAQQRTGETLRALEATVARLATVQEQLTKTVNRLAVGQDKLIREVRDLKGLSHERTYRDKAIGIFGRLIRNGHDVTNWVADQLYEALEAGQVTDDDLRQVLAVDLLWGGEERKTKAQLIIVLEASWRAEMNDVERAYQNAVILRRIGLRAIGVVGGREWADKVIDQALLRGVLVTTNGHIDQTSWENAWAKLVETK
jgi:hypothetical protein